MACDATSQRFAYLLPTHLNVETLFEFFMQEPRLDSTAFFEFY